MFRLWLGVGCLVGRDPEGVTSPLRNRRLVGENAQKLPLLATNSKSSCSGMWLYAALPSKNDCTCATSDSESIRAGFFDCVLAVAM